MHIPTGLLASVVACKNGVKRAHLVSAHVDGGLILELYSRDGVGTMISTDFYEVRRLWIFPKRAGRMCHEERQQFGDGGCLMST